METLFIPVLQGTSRHERQSIKVSRLIEEQIIKRDGLSSQLVDPADFNFPGDGNDPEGKDPRYGEIVSRADGFVIVVPEYNRSFPGSLKRMLDSEFSAYHHKPAALVGVSSGMIGGAIAIESLVPVLRKMKIVTSSVDTLFPKVKELFDENGRLVDQDYIDRIDRSLDELVWLAKTLKAGKH